MFWIFIEQQLLDRMYNGRKKLKSNYIKKTVYVYEITAIHHMSGMTVGF